MTEGNKTEPVAEQLGTQELPEVDVTKEHINNFEAHTLARSLIEGPLNGGVFQNEGHFNFIQQMAFQTLDFTKTIMLIGGTNEEKVAKLEAAFEDLKKFNLKPTPEVIASEGETIEEVK